MTATVLIAETSNEVLLASVTPEDAVICPFSESARLPAAIVVAPV